MLQQQRNRRGRRPGGRAWPGRSTAAWTAASGRWRRSCARWTRPSRRTGTGTLRSVPGIGAKTVLHLVVLLPRWQTLTGGEGRDKGLVASVGLDPQPTERGTSVRGRAAISRRGERDLRRRLFMAALGGTRRDNALRRFYRRLVARGKAKKLALVAAARKLLVWAWAVFRRQQPSTTACAAPAVAVAA